MKKIKNALLLFLFMVIGSYSSMAQTIDDTLAFDVNINKSGYAAQTKTIGNYNWELSEFLQTVPPAVGDLYYGANCLRGRSNAIVSQTNFTMQQDKTNGLSEISFYAARYQAPGDKSGISPVISAEYSINQGGSWTSVGTANLSGIDALQKYTFNNINVAGNVRIRLIVQSGDANKRFTIDSLIFKGYEPAPCDAPTNLVATDNGDGSVTATWTAPSTAPGNGYKIAIVPVGNIPTANDFFINSAGNTSPSTDTLRNGTPLINGQTYDVYLLAVCDSVNSSFSDTLTTTVTISMSICESLVNVVTTSTTEGVISTKWNAPTNSPADGYKVAIVPTGNTPTAGDYFTVSSSDTTFSSNTLKNGTAITDGGYDVYVYGNCDDAAVNHSDTIQSAVTVTICKTPTNFTMVNNNDGSVTATWTEPVPTPVNGYQLGIMTVGNAMVPFNYFSISSGTATFTTDTLTNGASLAAGSTYYMSIYASCTSNSSNTTNDTVMVTDPSVCLVPTNIVAVNNNDSSITVSWTAPYNVPSDGYVVSIVPDGQVPGNDVFTFTNATTTFTTDTLPDGSKFGYNQTYMVYILSDCGSGDFSNPDSVAVIVVFPVPCDAPANVIVTDNEDGTMNVSWTAPTYTPNDGYKLAVVKQGDVPTAGDYFTVAGSATSFTTDTLNNGTALIHDSSYVVYIYSACSIANNDYSDTIIDTVHVTIVLPCNAPTNFVFNSNNGGEATATWTIPANSNSGFKLAVVPNGATPTAGDYFTIPVGVSAFTTDTLTDGTALLEDEIYKAYIYSACGATHTSTTASDTALIKIKPCPAPTNLVVVDNHDGTVTLTWDASVPAPAEGYLITSNAAVANNKITTSTTFRTDSLPDGSYTFSVKAICNSSISNYSTAVSQSIATQDTIIGYVGVGVVSSEIVALYPNPAVTTLSLDMNVSSGIAIIMDLTGKEVSEKVIISSKHTELNISELPVGMYQVMVISNTSTSIMKFVKQ